MHVHVFLGVEWGGVGLGNCSERQKESEKWHSIFKRDSISGEFAQHDRNSVAVLWLQEKEGRIRGRRRSREAGNSPNLPSVILLSCTGTPLCYSQGPEGPHAIYSAFVFVFLFPRECRSGAYVGPCLCCGAE